MNEAVQATSKGTSPTTPAYQELIGRIKEAKLLNSTEEVLSWDQQVMMPAKGIAHRSRQLAQLARIGHEMATEPKINDLLAACEDDANLTSDPTSAAAVNIREIRRDYDRKTKIPPAMIAEEAEISSLAQHEWAEARKESDFMAFQPWLDRIVELLKRKAERFGWPTDGEPWDALAEDYEPGCTAEQVDAVFIPLRDRLRPLLDKLMGSSTTPSNAFNELPLPIEQQQKFVRFVAEWIGFDFSRGRLDQSTHPFCGGSHCNDVRLTTRFANQNVNDALGSTMHESGHGMYEQGLLTANIGTPMGEAVSLGIHESQSRMWENQVGRSVAFWKWCFPKLKEFFGPAIDSLSFAEVYGGANIVQAGFIRVEADEATYNMHIIVRFEIERALLKGDLSVADIPGAWNEMYKEYLGLDVPDDRRGCLQDIHWSICSIGYFPTYTLGNLYCAQFFEKALADIPGLYDQFAKGEFAALKSWLNENIHAHGQRYSAADLCEHVTGRSLTADPFIRHLESKLLPVYGL